jgi:hypothetical protein
MVGNSIIVTAVKICFACHRWSCQRTFSRWRWFLRPTDKSGRALSHRNSIVKKIYRDHAWFRYWRIWSCFPWNLIIYIRSNYQWLSEFGTSIMLALHFFTFLIALDGTLLLHFLELDQWNRASIDQTTIIQYDKWKKIQTFSNLRLGKIEVFSLDFGKKSICIMVMEKEKNFNSVIQFYIGIF